MADRPPGGSPPASNAHGGEPSRAVVGLLVNAAFLVGLLPLVVLLALLMALMAWIPIIGLLAPRQRLADSLGLRLRRYITRWARSSARFGLNIAPATRGLLSGTRVLRFVLGVAVNAIFLAVFLVLGLATSLVWLIPVIGWLAVGKALSIYLGIWQMSGAFFGLRVGVRGTVRPARIGAGKRPIPRPVPNLPKWPAPAAGAPQGVGPISTGSRKIDLGVPITIAPIEEIEDPWLQRTPGWVAAAVRALALSPVLPQLARTSEIALLPYAGRATADGQLPMAAWSLSAASLGDIRRTVDSSQPGRPDVSNGPALPDGTHFVFAPSSIIPRMLAQHLPQTIGVWVVAPACANTLSSEHALHFGTARLGYRGNNQRQGVVALAPNGSLCVLAPPGWAAANP